MGCSTVQQSGYFPHQTVQFIEIRRLGEREKSAEVLCFLVVSRAAGTFQHDDRERSKRVGVSPAEEVKAIHGRHVEVEDNQFRQGEFRPIAIFAFTLQVFDGGSSIRDALKRYRASGVSNGNLEKSPVVLVIFHEEDLRSFRSFTGALQNNIRSSRAAGG